MLRQPANKQMDYYYSKLLGEDWQKQLEQVGVGGRVGWGEKRWRGGGQGEGAGSRRGLRDLVVTPQSLGGLLRRAVVVVCCTE
jgi:hypothetical protein